MTTNQAAAAALSEIVHHICALLSGRMVNFIHQRRTLNDPALALVSNTMAAVARRFAAVMARLDAGTLRRPPVRKPPIREHGAPPGKTPATRKPCQEWPYRLRSTPGWLYKLIEPKHHLAHWGDRLHEWIHSAELQAQIAQAPQLRRILSPLCTMIGVELPPRPEPSAPESGEAPKPRRTFNAAWPWHPRILKDNFPPGFRPENYQKIA